MIYQTLSNENRLLYRRLTIQNEKLDKIKEILQGVNFFDISYLELYEKLSKICEIMEV